jgi:sensor histidine kinase YesM
MGTSKLRILLHATGVTLFVFAPFIASQLQGTDLRDIQRYLDTGADMNTFFVRHSWLRFSLQNLLLCGLFYANYLLLTPKLLITGQWLKYIPALILVSIGTTALVWYWHVLVDRWIGSHPMPFHMRFVDTSLTQFLLLSISLALAISEHNRRLVIAQQEKEKLLKDAELQLLHSRINPHFIFNTLNNIYSLSIVNSPATSDAILRLSSLLRFLVYESGKEAIPVAKELDYIADYVALETIRAPENLEVIFSLEGEKAGVIHPMLLIPFIENAFKHGRTMKNDTSIVVRIVTDGQHVRLHTENPVIPKENELTESGIGNSNTQRRLELLYPNRHALVVNNDGITYTVDLNIKLYENPLHSH